MFRLGLVLLTGSLYPALSLAQMPLNTGKLILSPHFFPGWQAQHVTHPFVMYEGTRGGYRMYYAGSSSTQVNESLWDQWVTGVVTSQDAVNWKYPDNYEQVLFATKLMEGDVISVGTQDGAVKPATWVEVCRTRSIFASAMPQARTEFRGKKSEGLAVRDLFWVWARKANRTSSG